MAYRGKRLTRDEWIDKYEVVDNVIYIAAGCNTYEIKDDLKELGARYFSGLTWFFTKNNLPDDETLAKLSPDLFIYCITVEEVFKEDGYYVPGILDQIQDFIHQKLVEKNKAKYGASEWVGEIGERLRNMKATYISAKYFEGKWGGSFCYTFKADDNIFTWFSQTVIDPAIEPNDDIILSGTVKNHTEYNGVLQTQLNRCIVKKGSV